MIKMFANKKGEVKWYSCDVNDWRQEAIDNGIEFKEVLDEG